MDTSAFGVEILVGHLPCMATRIWPGRLPWRRFSPFVYPKQAPGHVGHLPRSGHLPEHYGNINTPFEGEGAELTMEL